MFRCTHARSATTSISSRLWMIARGCECWACTPNERRKTLSIFSGVCFRRTSVPVQHIQTDRGGEFFGMPFQEVLRKYAIKFRPSRLGVPHLNGKVERSQKTDHVEFWDTTDITVPQAQLEEQLSGWQHYYNWDRPHSAPGNKIPMDRCCELLSQNLIKTKFSASTMKRRNPRESKIIRWICSS